MESTSARPIMPIAPAKDVSNVRRFLETRFFKLNPNAMPALMDVGLNALSLFFFFLERLLSPSLSKMALDSSPTFLIATLRLWFDVFFFLSGLPSFCTV